MSTTEDIAPEKVEELANGALDWYWKFGQERKGQYEVSLGSTVDRIYRARRQAAAIERSGLDPKPCMALWGPSQTGKSTLLSGYLDVIDGDELGKESALTWDENEPIRFGGELKSDGSNIVLNPYNGGGDGSGCISRFFLADAIPSPACPVSISLATEAQVVHALAAGYESECEAASSSGGERFWSEESVRALIEDTASEDGLSRNRKGFEALHQIVEVLELLIKGGLRRYVNLAAQWDQTLRPLLLNTAALADQETLDAFAAELFWDSWPSLTDLNTRLQKKRREVQAILGGRSFTCSWRVAALLLDIDAYKHYANTERPDVKSTVDTIGHEESGQAVELSPNRGAPLFPTGEDFGLFQGLVWELRIPVRRSVLEKRSPVVTKFFQVADLLDFPGVSNEYEGAKKITDDDLKTGLVRGLTEVLKRGKTASIAVSRAVELDIDGFSILARVGKHPGQPKQLVSGIRSWMLAYGKKWPPQSSTEMPLNLVITFCAKLINDACYSGISKGLNSYFSLFSKLADLADPRVVTTFATTYPWLKSEGAIGGYPEDKVSEVVSGILKDQAFKERFGQNVVSFEKMVADGGTDYFFDSLTRQATESRRGELLAKRLAEGGRFLREALRPHLPSKNTAEEARNKAIDDWMKGIEDKLAVGPTDSEYDSAVTLGRRLRRFLNVDHEELEPLPQRAVARHVALRAFVDQQFQTWRSARASSPDVEGLGFEDSAHAQRVLAGLVEGVDVKAVVDFFRDSFGHINGRTDSQEYRRFLAIRMSSALLETRADGGANGKPAGGAQLLDALRRFAAAEDRQAPDRQYSPHYVITIRPLLRRLEQIKQLKAGDRPAQAGDPELESLLGE